MRHAWVVLGIGLSVLGTACEGGAPPGCEVALYGPGCVRAPVNVATTPPGGTQMPLATSVPGVTIVPASSWRAQPPSPAVVPLTTIEETAVRAALAQLPAFAPAVNGCESRAHVVFNAIDAPSQHKAFKVWVFTTSAVSRAIAVDLPAAPNGSHIEYGGAPGSSWNYHVAAGYAAGPGDVRVVDALMSSEPQRLDDWLRKFTYVGGAVLTVLPGDRYLFQSTGGPAHVELTGTFWGYDGCFKKTHDAAKSLAAEALSDAVLHGKFPACSWKSFAHDAVGLSGAFSPFLAEETFAECISTPEPTAIPPRPAAPSDCAEAASMVRAEVSAWEGRGL